jgi:hypothetical protein
MGGTADSVDGRRSAPSRLIVGLSVLALVAQQLRSIMGRRAHIDTLPGHKKPWYQGLFARRATDGCAPMRAYVRQIGRSIGH